MSRVRKQIIRDKLPPLKRFDYALVGDRLEGLLLNTDRDLERKTKAAVRVGDRDTDRQISLI